MTKKKDPKDYKKMGRPTKYNPLYCKRLLEYFEIDPITFKDITITYKDGSSKEVTEEEAALLPTFYKFARSIGTYHDVLLEWCKKYPDFAKAYLRAKEAQQWFISENALRENYSGYFAGKLMVNMFKWSDTQKVEHSGKVMTATVDLTGKPMGDLIDFFRESVSKGNTG